MYLDSVKQAVYSILVNSVHTAMNYVKIIVLSYAMIEYWYISTCSLSVRIFRLVLEQNISVILLPSRIGG